MNIKTEPDTISKSIPVGNKELRLQPFFQHHAEFRLDATTLPCISCHISTTCCMPIFRHREFRVWFMVCVLSETRSDCCVAAS